MPIYNFCYTKNMIKKVFLTIFLSLLLLSTIYHLGSKTVFSQTRYAACDLCGYCPPNPAPQSWSSCQKCLYPGISSDPSARESLIIDPTTNLPIAGAFGKQYTFLGCLGGGVGGVSQSILNIIFGMSGGIAFLYLLYGSFIIAISQANPEKLNYGRRVVLGAIIGLIFTIGSVFIVKFISSGILKIPGFGE